MSDAYKQAGVDIAAGNEAVERMKKHVKRTLRPEVMGGLGGFGGLFGLDKSKYEEPVLVSGTDGVGTKLKLAFAMDKHDTIGIDAVAMCVNDIVVQGAEPLFFLDYLACDKVVPEKIEAIVAGIAEGCVQSGCALIGGETAEMPGMYAEGEYDIAGFSVGVVDRKKMIDGSTIRPGDVVIGFASSGVHSNGFSLVRKLLLEKQGYNLTDRVDALGGEVLGNVLLTPTKIYVKSVLALMDKIELKGLVHITGGGFPDNIPRVLPKAVNAEIDRSAWEVPTIFKFIQNQGKVDRDEMYRVFNMGIGYVVILPKSQLTKATNILKAQHQPYSIIGVIRKGTGVVTYKN